MGHTAEALVKPSYSQGHPWRLILNACGRALELVCLSLVQCGSYDYNIIRKPESEPSCILGQVVWLAVPEMSITH